MRIRNVFVVVLLLCFPMTGSAQDLEVEYDKFTDSTKVMFQGQPIQEDGKFFEAIMAAAKSVGEESSAMAEPPILIRGVFDCAGEGVCRPSEVRLMFASSDGGQFAAGSVSGESDGFALIFLLNEDTRLRFETEPMSNLLSSVAVLTLSLEDFRRLANAETVEYRLGDVEAKITDEQHTAWKRVLNRMPSDGSSEIEDDSVGNR